MADKQYTQFRNGATGELTGGMNRALTDAETRKPKKPWSIAPTDKKEEKQEGVAEGGAGTGGGAETGGTGEAT
jgi:hypothetical protein